MERAAPGVIYTDLNACDKYERGLEDASVITCRALLILGQSDLLTPPRKAHDLTNALTDVQTVVLEKVRSRHVIGAP